MNKKLKWLLVPGLFTAIVIYLDACKLGRFVYNNFSDITDYGIFPSRPLKKSEQPFHFPIATNPGIPEVKDIFPGMSWKDWSQALEESNTVAFLIIRNDSICLEQYANEYEASSTIASFSMAKSFISVLIGMAIEDGWIQSEEDLVVRYIPELKDNGFEHVTIRHLLQMTSGLDFNESYYSPFSEAADFYYGTRLRQAILNLKLKSPPGIQFEYTSGNTQLLGLVLERALQDKTVTQYLQEKIWTPLQMEYDASWSIDRKEGGIEKTFCCINARARDFAKLGRLLVRHGQWNEQVIIPPAWMSKIEGTDTREAGSVTYQYQFWKGSLGMDYMARGHLGQFIYVHPELALVIVRLGKDQGDVVWQQVFERIAVFYAQTGSPGSR